MTVGTAHVIRATVLRKGLAALSDAEGLTVTRGTAAVTVGPVDADGGRPVTFRIGADTFTGRMTEQSRGNRWGGHSRGWKWVCVGCGHLGYLARAVDGNLVCGGCAKMQARVWSRRTVVERAAQRLLLAEMDATRARVGGPGTGKRGARQTTKVRAGATVAAARDALQRARTDVARVGLARLRKGA